MNKVLPNSTSFIFNDSSHNYSDFLYSPKSKQNTLATLSHNLMYFQESSPNYFLHISSAYSYFLIASSFIPKLA